MGLVVNCKSENSQYWNRNEITLAYFDDIKKYPMLSVEEERKLLINYKNGNKYEQEKALHKLVESNQRFVVSVARRWSTQDNLMDIVNEANLGLIKAIESFDLSKKQRLITYAVFWMRKYITNYVCLTSKMVKPVNAHKVFTYVNKITNKYFAENGRMPYADEIQDILQEKYNIILSNEEDILQYTISSIDARVSSDDDEAQSMSEVGSFATATATDNITSEIEASNTKHIIYTILSTLSNREEDIIKRYFGIDCDEETLDTIAEKYNLSRERCRQIVNNVIDKLKELVNKKNLF